MLDAFIIEKIRRDRESRSNQQQIPLHVEIPMEPSRRDDPRARREEDEPNKRGVTIVDYSI